MNALDLAFQTVNRSAFVPASLRDIAEADKPLPIGYGQTISQPSTVRRMFEWLDASAGQTVLDIGSGSGWTTALLSTIVGDDGKVFAVERIPELVRFGRENCKRFGITNAEFFEATGEYGLLSKAPYDRILVSAAASDLPRTLLFQLKIGGKMVIPVRNNILEITKLAPKRYDTKIHPGFVFVPLV